jgi:hypothetical protein
MGPPLSVVVGQFDDDDKATCVVGLEAQDEAELVVDTYRMLPKSVAGKLLQAKAAKAVEVALVNCGDEKLHALAALLDEVPAQPGVVKGRVDVELLEVFVLELDSHTRFPPSPLG